jgi:hypothetical protein
VHLLSHSSVSLLCTQASKGKQKVSFYTMPEYEAWKESLGGKPVGWNIKYYKVCNLLASTPRFHSLLCVRHSDKTCLIAVVSLWPAGSCMMFHVPCMHASS